MLILLAERAAKGSSWFPVLKSQRMWTRLMVRLTSGSRVRRITKEVLFAEHSLITAETEYGRNNFPFIVLPAIMAHCTASLMVVVTRKAYRKDKVKGLGRSRLDSIVEPPGCGVKYLDLHNPACASSRARFVQSSL
ncbi:hypothetical protein EDD22DRAFT_851416 [Suillus occidentalis]|nr:hypothetical protein EDD22DRAFT_851416 [Suillus occidentalis]